MLPEIPDETSAPAFPSLLLHTAGARRILPQMPAPLQPRTDFTARLAGLFFFLMGAGAIYWQVWLPIQHAQEDRPLLEYSLKLIILGECFLIMGGWWIFGGLRAYESVRTIKDHPKRMKWLMATSFCLALLSWWGLEKLFGMYGYLPQ